MSPQNNQALIDTPIHLIQEGNPVSLDQHGVQRTVPPRTNPWYGFPIEFHSIPAQNQELGATYNPHPLL